MWKLLEAKQTSKKLHFFSKLKQYLKEPRDGRVVDFQGIPEPDVESPQELQGIDSISYLLGGGHMIPCAWSNQLWVKDLNHESHLST